MGRPMEIRVVYNHLPRISSALRSRVSEIVRKTALAIEKDWKEAMEGPKHGRIYRRPGGRLHQASAPGEAPAIDTGTYHNAIHVERVNDLEAIVTSGNLLYPYILEFGGAKVAPRPAAGPAAEKNRPDFIAALSNLEDRLR